MTRDELVQFLREAGLTPAMTLDDDPAHLWISAGGVKRLLELAPDDSGSFSVREMLARLVPTLH